MHIYCIMPILTKDEVKEITAKYEEIKDDDGWTPLYYAAAN